MDCPRDGTELRSAVDPEHESVRVHQCPTCSGIWLSRQTFEAMVAKNEVNLPTDFFRIPPEAEKPKGDVICPSDREAMFARSRHGIEIDICRVCSGLWFDPGELRRVLEQAGKRGLMDFWGADLAFLATSGGSDFDLSQVFDGLGEALSGLFDG